MRNILIVDDEEQIRKLLHAILVGAGYQPRTAKGAAQAIELLDQSGCFDIVLSDVRMPGMDGHELARKIAARCPTTRVILMSAYDPGCEMCPYVGQCKIVQKPFRLEQVLG